MQIIIILLALPGLIVFIDFICFLIGGYQVVKPFLFRIAEVCSMLILPLLYSNFGKENDCCADDFNTAVFSPEHQLTIAVLIILCLTAYFYSSYRTTIAPPIIEVTVNAFLIIGIVLNIFIAIHTNEFWLALGGNIPIICLAILVLAKNHRTFIYFKNELNFAHKNSLERIAWKILLFPPFLKYPIVIVLCLPVLIIVISFLLIFGQKPDSFIRAFTDTYKHGLSQWDYMCDDVECDGHYLCSVAANGHSKLVKPQRKGIRNGKYISCNRQLLISNAFEDLLKEYLPLLHKKIRKQYNKVGNLIHKYYYIFKLKVISDIIYILMKPLEWLFIITLYMFDTNPENRIAKQYVSAKNRQQIESYLKTKVAIKCKDYY